MTATLPTTTAEPAPMAAGTVFWLARRLARSGGASRAALVAGGAAISTLTLLVAAGVPATRSYVMSRTENELLLASVTALVVPVIALLAAVARLSAGIRDRRLASLRVLGLTAAATRLVAAVEAALLAALGVVAGSGLFVALQPVIEHIDSDGDHWLRGQTLRPGPLGWPLATVGVLAVSLVVALLPARQVTRDPLATRRQAATARPRIVRLVPLALGVAVVAFAVATGRRGDIAPSTPWLWTFFGGTVLAALGLPVAIPVLVRLLADLLVRVRRAPAVVLAGRRMQQQPAVTTRLIATLAVTVFVIAGAECVLGAIAGTPQAVRAHLALTTGPQSAEIGVSATRSPDIAALAAVPGVRSVTREAWVSLACGSTVPTTGAIPQTCAQQALVARCADLPGLAIRVAHCTDGRPEWLLDGGFDSAVSGLGLPGVGSAADGPPDALEQPNATGSPVLLDLSSRGTVTRTLRLPPVRTTAALEAPDPKDPDWGSNGGVTLLVPPGTPGALALLHGQPATYLAVLDGGPGPLRALRAAAARQGLVAASDESTADWQVVLDYRHFLDAMAAALLALGFAALLITAADSALERRSHLAALAVVGVPPAVIRRSQLAQVAGPLLVGLPLAGGCGLLAGIAYLDIGGDTAPVPWSAVVVLVVLATAAALVVAALTLVGLGARVRARDLRRE